MQFIVTSKTRFGRAEMTDLKIQLQVQASYLAGLDRIYTLKMKREIRVFLAAIAAVLFFLLTIYPTPFAYETHNGIMFRTNRFTGVQLITSENGWRVVTSADRRALLLSRDRD